MNLIFSNYCKFLKDKCGLELEEGYYWLDRQIIKCFDKSGNIHKLYRLKIENDLSMSYSVPSGYSSIGKEEIESWNETVCRYKHHLKCLEEEALELIRTNIKKYDKYKPFALTSGGKDSSIVMFLLRKIIPDSYAIFNNTSLDCADVYRYINNINNCIVINPKEGFYQWRKRMDFIPTRFARSCCSIFKEGAMIENLDNDKNYLFFMGMRNQESSHRSSYLDIWHNDKWVDNWDAILPIRKWSELEVWLYILYRQIPINDKYKKGYSRCGCAIACPFASKSTWVLDEYWYPNMRKRWLNILEKDFIEQGKWTILNCTKQEYLQTAWNGGRVRDEPTEEIIQEFMEYKGIDSYDIAKKYFNNQCVTCGKKLKKDAVALSLKYYGRNTSNAKCINCISDDLGRTKDELKQDIELFKSQGCNLF